MYYHCHTFYSFRYGMLSVKQLLERAQALKVKRLAVTDINNTSACMELMREAHKYGVQPLLGIDFRNSNRQQYIGLARNHQGFAELNRHLSVHLHQAQPFADRAPEFEHAWVIYPFQTERIFTLAEHEWLGVRYEELNKLRFSEWMKQRDRLVVLHPVTFANKKDFNAHRLLRAIDTNALLSALPVEQQALPNEIMMPEQELMRLFDAYPFLITNTQHMMDECFTAIQLGTPKNKKSFTGSLKEDRQLLRQLTYQGLSYRYPQLSDTITERVEKELEIITQKGFTSYFLINWDIVQFAQRKGFFYVGRGSGANSIVAYSLRITDVDPVDLDLYFERFINLYRENPPDFDLDFSWKDRDAVTQHIFDTHGPDHTCLLATYSTFQSNSIVRELGKVFGLPKADIEELIANFGKQPAPNELGRLVYVYAQYLHEFPNHLSIHAGGVLISEKPIYYYTATSLPPKGYATSQFDMHLAEDVGLYKFDILSQRGLGHIRDTIHLVKQNQGQEIDIHCINDFKQDVRIKQHLRTGNTTGCFYVESPAMRMLLSKLEADDYLGLVAASSIIRPGVARSGMMREYILRHRFASSRKKAHPIMMQIMPETYGVMVYQEDVIKVAHLFAGLSLAEADVLRRGMSGKFRSREEFQKVKDRFFENCQAKGYDPTLSAEVWFQIESFAGYSFSKGHSASYAVESYQSLYLKAYFPMEFMVGVINNFGGFYRTEFYVHEARMVGAKVEAPCINQSQYLSSIQGSTIYLGFIHLARLEQQMAEALVRERDQNGAFTSLEQLLFRVPMGLEQLLILVRIGAFRFTGKLRQQLLWEAHFLVNKKPKKLIKSHLFQVDTATKQWKVPDLLTHPLDEVLDQIELLGFPLASPFQLVKKSVQGIAARQLPEYAGRQVQAVGYLVTVKPTRTVKGERMYFGTFVDQAGHWIDTVHFPPVAARFPFRGQGCYLLRGKVTEEFGFYTLEVNFMERLEYFNRDDIQLPVSTVS